MVSQLYFSKAVKNTIEKNQQNRKLVIQKDKKGN